MLPTHILEFDDGDTERRTTELYRRPAWRRRQLIVGNDRARVLYKYFSFDPESLVHERNVRSVVVDSRLWFSKPSSFNDPFDFRCHACFPQDPAKVRKYLASSAKREAKRTTASKVAARKEAQRLFQIAFNRYRQEPDSANVSFKRIRDRHGVCCFTTQPRSLLMWAHYAQSHTGLCFQFDSAAQFEFFALAKRINYAPDFPRLEWPTDKNRVIEDVIFRKYDIWQYEDERRIVDGACVDAPKSFSPQALRGIVCGYRMSTEARDKLRELLEERRRLGMPSVNLYQCVPEDHSYRMKIRTLELTQ